MLSHNRYIGEKVEVLLNVTKGEKEKHTVCAMPNYREDYSLHEKKTNTFRCG